MIPHVRSASASGQRSTIAVALGLAAIVCWLTAPLVTAASANLRLLAVFYADETLLVRVMRDALEAGSPALQFGPYGHLPLNLALWPLLALSAISPVSDHAIVVALRLVSVVGGLGTVLAVVYWCRPLGGTCAGLAATLTLVASPMLLEWSAVAHPDTLQACLLTLSLACCTRALGSGSWGWGRRASIGAGLAFASKYGGIVLAPLLVLSAWRTVRVGTFERALIQRQAHRLRLAAAVTGAASSVVGFVVTPAVVASRLAADGQIDPAAALFVQALRMALMAGGALVLAASAIPLVWKRLLLAPRVVVFAWRTGEAIVLAGLAFAIASPWSLYRLQFLKGLYVQVTYPTASGSGSPLSNAIIWTGVLTEQVHVTVVMFAAIGILLAGWRFARHGWAAFAHPGCVAAIWVPCQIGALSGVSEFAPQYLLPVLPAVGVLSADAMVMTARVIRTIAPMRTLAVAGRSLVALALTVAVGLMTIKLLDARAGWAARETDSVAVGLGLWLGDRWPASGLVLADYFTYVPPVLPATYTFDGTSQDVRTLPPDLIVTHDDVRRLYVRTPGPQTNDAYRARQTYRRALVRGELGYRLWLRCGDIRVYVSASGRGDVASAGDVPRGCQRML